MHDELSALARTHFNSLSQLIEKGAATDGHPIGIQVFLFYWTKVFGENEMAVKFPFIICGLLSIIVAYRISKFWFNSSVGLVIAATMAVLQYFVMYSQLVRPYSFGILFSLLMVWCWSNYLFNTSSNKTKYLIGYVLASALCAYVHHFAFLFAIIVGITGFFFINKQNWKGYLLAAISVLVLYIPHINISLYQLSKGGVGGTNGWLGSPNASWLLHFFKYSFHYSNSMYGLGFVLILLSIYFYSDRINSTQKFRIISLFWFFTLFFIEYFYSVYVNPVLQFSTIIFVFPFLLMFAFSFFGELNSYLKTTLVSSILIIGTVTLAVTRKHFKIFYHQPYQEEITNTYKVLDKIGGDKKATIELMIPPLFKEHYFKKYGREFHTEVYNPFDEKLDTKAFRKFVNAQTTDYFIFGCPPLEYIEIIKEKYPYIITKEQGFNYSFYCFTKQKPTTELHEQVIFSNKIEAYTLDSTMEFGKEFNDKLKNIVNSRHVILKVDAEVSSAAFTANPILVADIQENGKSIEWYGSDYFNYNNNWGKPNTIYLSRDLTDFDFKKHPTAEIKIYIWNKNKKNISINNINIETIRANPFIYSLFEPID